MINRLDRRLAIAGDCEPRPANYVPLSPVAFLRRSARVHPHQTAVAYGTRRYNYDALLARCEQLAQALRTSGVNAGDVVAVVAHNTPELLEAHFGVPMSGAVLCAINTRLDADAVAFILSHSDASVVIADREFGFTVRAAVRQLNKAPLVVRIDDSQFQMADEADALADCVSYEQFLTGGDNKHPLDDLLDEWNPIALNYTSGTTGNPKGVLLHHRGAYLNAVANVMNFGLNQTSIYLWTLPMFHCNGWTFTWAVTLAGGTHVCFRGFDPATALATIERERVTHLCGAPVVLSMLLQAGRASQVRFDHPITIATGGAAPPSTTIAGMECMGFQVIHLYGMTECYGPAAICVQPQGFEDLTLESRARFLARQGVGHPLADEVTVISLEDGGPVSADGKTIGELVVRSNTVMMGYLKNPEATEEALAGGWLHTGDLAVIHNDGYVEIKDRLKDVIISGGENISSLEIEEVVSRHPSVLEAAAVARPDPHWGETPHLFVSLKGTAPPIGALELIAWCRARMAHFKCPRHVSFLELPKTATGKVKKDELRRLAAAEAQSSTEPGRRD